MRPEKLPDVDYDKVIWKCISGGTRDKASPQSNSEMWWRHTTATLFGVSFGSYKRRRREVIMRRCGYVHWDFLVRYHWDAVGCFIWDLFETLLKRTDGTSSLRTHEMLPHYTNKTSWRRTTETSWWRSTETSLDVSFETYLNVAGTYRETSLRHRHDVLKPGGLKHFPTET